MMQFHHGRWFGTTFFFIGGLNLTDVGFMFVGGRKPTYVGFLLEYTRKGHLIPGAVVFYIWRGCILHSRFIFPLGNSCLSENRCGGCGVEMDSNTLQ